MASLHLGGLAPAGLLDPSKEAAPVLAPGLIRILDQIKISTISFESTEITIREQKRPRSTFAACSPRAHLPAQFGIDRFRTGAQLSNESIGSILARRLSSSEVASLHSNGVLQRRDDRSNAQCLTFRRRTLLQFTNGKRHTATSRTTWSAIAHGDPKICPRTFPICLSAKVATLT
jgi:hypothetical protein